MSANEPVSSFSLVLGRLCFLLARVANEGKSEISGANTEERERERYGRMEREDINGDDEGSGEKP